MVELSLLTEHPVRAPCPDRAVSVGRVPTDEIDSNSLSLSFRFSLEMEPWQVNCKCILNWWLLTYRQY